MNLNTKLERFHLNICNVIPSTTTNDDNYDLEKIHAKYGDMKGELHMVEFARLADGLGLSLAGNRDRSKMSVFIVSIQPQSPAALAKDIRIGDELLEVRTNERSSHAVASRHIKWFVRLR